MNEPASIPRERFSIRRPICAEELKKTCGAGRVSGEEAHADQSGTAYLGLRAGGAFWLLRLGLGLKLGLGRGRLRSRLAAGEEGIDGALGGLALVLLEEELHVVAVPH